MKRVTCSLAIAALLAGISSVHAEAPWAADFKKADLNDSGGLSKVELDKSKSTQLNPLKDNFKVVDADADGHVTLAEYDQYLDRAQDKVDAEFEAKFKKADVNDSGGLSRKELEKVSGKEFDQIEKNFAAIDSDNDGQVAFAEYRKYHGATAKLAPMAGKDGCTQARHCGVVVAVDRYKVEGEGGMTGMVAGGVAGGVVGNQAVGGTLATVGGAAAGAFAGKEIQKRMNTKKMVKVTVKFDDGAQRNFDFEGEKSPFKKGARVEAHEGQLKHYKAD